MGKNQAKQAVDLIIVGGGPVGTLCACLGATQGLEVALVDKMDPKTVLGADFDGRTTSIAYGSSQILEAASAWALIQDNAHPILNIIVSDRFAPGHLTYDHTDIGDHPMGYMVENRYLRQGLYTRSTHLNNIHWFAPDGVAHIERSAFKVSVELDSGQILEAPLLVAADGKFSTIREEAGIECRSWDYHQSCMVFVADHEKPHHATAYESFHPNGPLATLPLGGTTSAVVWTDKRELADDLMALPGEDFHRELNTRFDHTLGEMSVRGQVMCYPLHGKLAKTVVAHRLALIGDAGHSLHPVAGQGMNLGIRDVKALIDLLVESRSLGGDIGAATVLKHYDRARKVDNASMAALTHGLVKLFSNDQYPLKTARSLGLSLVNKLPRTKKRITKHAMGL